MKSSKPAKDSGFFAPQNPFTWQNLLYSSAMGANIDPKLALNYMMSKYQEELMRQYSQQLGQTSMLTNPFAVNPLMASSVLSNPPPAHKEKDKGPVASTSKATEPARVKSSEKRDKSSDTTARYSKEASKPYYAESSDISLFKDRPGISITPIHQATAAPSAPKPVLPASPTKTLQQKLAERQKQNPAAQQKSAAVKKLDTNPVDMYSQYQSYAQAQKNISFAKPSIPLPPVPHSSKLLAGASTTSKIAGHYKNLAKSIPSALTIMKSQQSLMSGLQTGDSGISISQVAPHPQAAIASNMMNFRKPSASAPKLKMSRKLGSDITVTTNYKTPTAPEAKKDAHVAIPLSLSITKKDDNKPEPKKDDAVEIITIE